MRPPGREPSLPPEDQRALLRLARSAIGARLRGARREREEVEGRLVEHRGAFVTLTRRSDGELRGCIGYAEPVHPLCEAIVRGAVAAATEDSRFEPLSEDELPQVRVEISVLSPLRPARPEEVRVGEDGVVVQLGARRGLLLPQVATEWGWDRETLLSHASRKAGLSSEAWKEAGTAVYVFQADVFGED